MKVIIAIFIFLFGAILASFAGVIIYRVPNHISIIKPNSYCPSCRKNIKWYDNIPILSYIILKGKCRYCHAKIGAFSLILEILGALSFLLAFLRFGLSFELIFVLLLAFLFLIIAGIDYNTHYIYDIEQVLFFIITLGYFCFKIFYLKQDYLPLLIGGAVGFLGFFAIRVIGKLVMKVECLGLGDVILMGIAGLLLGWSNLIFAILIGSLVGSIIEVSLIGLKKKDRSSEIAFGPYLLFGTYIAMLYGDVIINWLMGMVM